MSTIRNFEQLIFVKQLCDDAKSLLNIGDVLSLTKSLIIIDLAIEQTLKTIILNLNPSFYIPRGRQDINWKDLWNEADSIIKNLGKHGLTEQVECTRLRELRNLVQHTGAQPTLVDVSRFVESAEKMLEQVFSDAFSLDFGNLRTWDFLNSNDLKTLLIESEDFLQKDDPIACIVGCKKTRDAILEVIDKYTAKEKNLHAPSPHNMRRTFRGIPELSNYLSEMEKFLSEKISLIKTELVFIGLGMPIFNTRRFIELGKVVGFSEAYDGTMYFRINTPGKEKDLDNLKSDAMFMLNYLYRLLSLINEKHYNLLDKIQVKKQLSKQITSPLSKL